MKKYGPIFLAFVCGVLAACGKTGWTVDQLQIPTSSSESTSSQGPSDLDDGFGQILNLPNILDRLNIKSAQQHGFHGERVKIAILDNGFADLDNCIGRSIPQDTRYEKNSHNAPAPTRHGTTMAELVYKISTGHEAVNSQIAGPEILLFNSNGFSNFEESVHKAIAASVDIILFAQVWEYGGNFDGQGFINAIVSQATREGILWVNAAGNYRNRVWSGPVRTDAQRQLLFDGAKAFLPFRIQRGQTTFKASLAWNDFRDQIDYATAEDLDLILEDADGKLIESSRKVQGGLERKDTPEWSAHAKETISTNLKSGNYALRVLKNSDNFDENSWVRLMIQGEFVELLARPSVNSILIPADNRGVITIGAEDFDNSSQSFHKPEIRMTSTVSFSSGRFIQGTSTAAAFAAAKLAVRISEAGPMTRERAVATLAQP